MSAFTDYLAALRTIAMEEGFVPSTLPNAFDTNRGRRVHKQFWVGGRLVTSEAVSQASDNTWEITYNIAWQHVVARSDVDFGFYELLDAIASLNNAWQSRLCAVWDEPVRVSSADPFWNEDLVAWEITLTVETLERRSWAPTS